MSSICRKGRKETQACAVPCTHGRGGEHKSAAGARAVVTSRKPERNKNGRKTLEEGRLLHSCNARKCSTKR